MHPAPHADEAVAAAKTPGTEIVQRWMSREELANIEGSGLLSRGGRAGDHFVTNSANRNAKRARQRLALGYTPDVRATLEVPEGVFSSGSRVNPLNSMAGGGLERIAPGHLDIPARVLDYE